MDEKGYIKFNFECISKKPVTNKEIKLINKWRKILFKEKLIGMYPNGVGYGNISNRIKSKNKKVNFIITGSATGNLKNLNKNHYSIILDYNLKKNKVICKGKKEPSSESMTHASIYHCSKNTNAVIHIHCLKLWKKLLGKVPTTSKKVKYGTPEMAYEIINLFKKTNVEKQKILVMGGHKEGIITFGKDLNEAGNILMKYYKKLK